MNCEVCNKTEQQVKAINNQDSECSHISCPHRKHPPCLDGYERINSHKHGQWDLTNPCHHKHQPAIEEEEWSI